MFKKSVLVMLAALLIFSVTVSAQEEVLDLEEVVVTASRYEESIMDTPVSIEVIDQEEIEESNAQNVAELLDTFTGTYIKDNGGPNRLKNVRIRGAGSNKVLILIDGQVVNDPQGGGFDLSMVSPQNIKKIEVIKGPASVIYGANAVGGVVNIITKDIEVEPETNLSMSYGSYNNLIYNLSHSEKIGDLGVRISYTDKNSDGIEDGEKLDQEIIYTKFNYQLNNYSDLTFTFENNDSEKSVFGYDNSGNEVITDQDDLLQNSHLKWNQEKENYKTTIDIFHNYQEKLYPSDNSKHEKYQRGLNINNTNYLNKHILNYGLEIKENEVKSTNLVGTEKTNLNKALFIKDNWNYNQNLDFVFAARYDDHEEYGSNLSPQVAANYKLNNQYTTYLSYAEAFKSPTFDDMYVYFPSFDPAEYNDYFGNPNLKAEESENYELGLKFEKESYQGSIAYFERKVDNLIKYLDRGPSTPSTMINLDGTSEFSGIELDLEKSLTKNLNSNLNYTYLDARDKDGEQISDNPYHNAKLSLNYSMGKKVISLSGRLISNYRNGFSAEKRASFFILDSKLKTPLEISNKKFKLVFSINNLLDKDYQVNKGYPMPGRNFMLNLSTKF